MRRLGSETLVIATHNTGKLKEIAALLAPYGVNCISAGSLGLSEPAETGKTFMENALIKARAAAKSSGLPALADDSGLCVVALDGAPGVYTADWAERQWFEGLPNQPWQGRDWYMAMGKVEGMLAEMGPGSDRSGPKHRNGETHQMGLAIPVLRRLSLILDDQSSGHLVVQSLLAIVPRHHEVADAEDQRGDDLGEVPAGRPHERDVVAVLVGHRRL